MIELGPKWGHELGHATGHKGSGRYPANPDTVVSTLGGRVPAPLARIQISDCMYESNSIDESITAPGSDLAAARIPVDTSIRT